MPALSRDPFDQTSPSWRSAIGTMLAGIGVFGVWCVYLSLFTGGW